MSYCNNSPIEETDRDETLLSVIPAIILECDRRSLEEYFDPNEVNTVFSEVRLALRFVPLEPHSEECSYAAWLRQGNLAHAVRGFRPSVVNHADS